MSTVDNKRISITLNNETKIISSYYKVSDSEISLSWSESDMQTEQTAESYIKTLKQCRDEFNWYGFCQSEELGVDLSTSPGFGLISDWSGQAFMEKEGQLLLTKVKFTSTTFKNSLTIKARETDIFTIKCDSFDTQQFNFSATLSNLFKECEIESLYNPILVSQLEVMGISQILTFSLISLRSTTHPGQTVEKPEGSSGKSVLGRT